jgi:peptidoglycan LD-endopeptidase CwlK
MDVRSETSLEGVHPTLVAIVRRAHAMMSEDAPGLSFIVTEGVRTVERQRALMSAGASQTMHSHHLARPTAVGVVGLAVDLAALVDGEVRWDWPIYPRIARRMKAAASEIGARITWGGDWTTFPDGPHFQLEDVA